MKMATIRILTFFQPQALYVIFSRKELEHVSKKAVILLNKNCYTMEKEYDHFGRSNDYFEMEDYELFHGSKSEEKEDDLLKDLFKRGRSKSNTFRKLAKKTNVKEDNLDQIVSYGDETATVVETGLITINKGRGNDLASFTHELTNRKNAKELRINNYNVRFGKISVEEYANIAIEIELEALMNQFIVMNESKEKFGDKYMDSLLIEYTNENGNWIEKDLKEESEKNIEMTI